MMRQKTFLPLGLLLVFGLLLLMAIPAAANPQAQAFYQTPTPGPDGRIIYTVKAGDSCLSISLLTGMDITQLRLLNNLDEECFLSEGQELLLGVIEEVEPTAGPSPTPTQSPPTPTPFSGNGEICVYLFNDVNGNAMAEESETGIKGGAISLTDRQGQISRTKNTESIDEPVCFEDLPEGEYNISVAPPEGYNPTTTMNYPLVLNAGDYSIVDFGAQISSAGEAPVEEAGGRSPILGILGAVLLLAGVGLGIYFRQTSKTP